MRKRDWLMAAALVPYFVVMLPIAMVGALGMVAWGLWRPRSEPNRADLASLARSARKSRPIRTLTGAKI